MKLKTFFNFVRPVIGASLLAILYVFISTGFSVSCAIAKSVPPKNAVRVLIVGGGSSHDFDRWYKQADATTLRQGGFAVIYTNNTDSIAFYLPQTDVLYLSNNQPIKNPAVRQAIFDFVNAGKGLIMGHAALWYNWKDWPEYNLQLVSGGTRSHDRYGSFDVTVVNKKHPIMKGVESKITLKDERYHYEPDATGPGIEVLATNSVAGSDVVYPSIFVVKNPKARIVGIALGHDAESHDIQFYKTVLLNAVKWAAHR
jgi:type 1 glutamine amidotransferase